MQITIEIPDELSDLIQNKGKSLNVAILEALGLSEIDWAAKWEQWFAEFETVPIPTTAQAPQNDYTALLIDKYRKQGLEL
ncbi:hypothetical protein TUMEXPCC7403_02605 [Tumidithrix helvetica PCC 7403]|uniref:hypothetical protein n=1 Tax=Tumidithrix helvetica TaxID=3457545 RepID=UPI003C898DC1